MCILVCVLQQGQERVETNNEQRLPLKKRHYHISTAAASLQPTNSLPQVDTLVTEVDCTKKALERTTTQEKDKLPVTSSVGVGGKSQGRPTADKPVIVRDKSACGSGVCSTGLVNSGEVKSKPVVDVPRNSIDEAIEACITRYTATSPPVENSTPSVHSVIATPKKRHRLETAAAVAGMMGKSPCTSVNKSKESAAEGATISGSKLSGIAVTTPPPSKRTVSRSASANSGNVVTVSSDSSVTPDTIKTSVVVDSSVCGSSEATVDSTTNVSPTQKVSSSVGKVTSSCKVSPAASKMASQTNKATSPASKTSVSLSKNSGLVSKPCTVMATKVSSPTKVTAANSKVSSSPVKQTSPVSKASISSPSKVTASQSSSATKVSSTSGSKAVSPSSKVTSSLSKSLVPASKAASPKAFAVSSKVNSFPSTIVTVSASTVTTTTTTAATVAATAVVTTATTTITTVSTSAVDEMMLSSRLAVIPMQHNLRLKRANGTSERDESHLKRGGIGKKKKLIRDIRVHVTKLSPTDFLLKKAVGTVKQRVRRRKAINRTGFPVKKKKKKQCVSGDAKPLKCPNSAPVPTPLSAPVINIDIKKSPAYNSTTKTLPQSIGGKEILNRAETKRTHGLCKKDRSSRISESCPKDRKVEKEDGVKGELEKKPLETVRKTVNGKRDALHLPHEDISLKEKKEHSETKSGEDGDTTPNKLEDTMEVVGGDAQCSETKESQLSLKQNKGSVVDSGHNCSKLTELCSLTVPEADPGLPVASGHTLDAGDKDCKVRNKRKRDSSKDDCPLPLGSKRMRRYRDDDMDQDDR